MSPTLVEAAIETTFREEWGRIVATLIRRTGDWDLAEECAQEAFTEALRRWPVQGIPRRRGAWPTTVAANRAIDRSRRRRRGSELEAQAEQAQRESAADAGELAELLDEGYQSEDDRLRLIFTCCHPALPLEGQVALTLRTLSGLSTAEIARAFLVPEATMAKRLTRTKTKIAAARIPYRVPPKERLPERTEGVLAVLYLMFNEGNSASSGEELLRPDLAAEAVRLGRALRQLMPGDPEVAGALALMLLHHARRRARVGDDGELATLEEQDRSRWEAAEIAEGLTLLDAAGDPGHAGPYRLQAEIAACHMRAESAAKTDWQEVARLYLLLEDELPSPVVRLNRAVAVAMSDGIDQGLAMVDELQGDPRLGRYHLLEATRADLLRRQGSLVAAAAAYGRALALAPSEPERRYLLRRLREVELPADPRGPSS